jgi:hypothetical protein
MAQGSKRFIRIVIWVIVVMMVLTFVAALLPTFS